MSTTPKHWNYFLAVEAELVAVTRYVEFAEANYGCYSNELAKLILLAGGEVDSIFRELCAHLAPEVRAGNMPQYFPILTEKYPDLGRCELVIPRYGLTIQPWDGWTADERPSWWTQSYNKLKHERSAHFEKATLGAALKAIGAQFLALNLYHHAVNNVFMEVNSSMASVLYDTKAPEGMAMGGMFHYYDPFEYIHGRAGGPLG